MSNNVETIRARLAESGRPYSDEAKKVAIAYAQGERRRGTSVTRVARQLGISPVTLMAWLSSSALVPVEIVPATTTQSLGSTVVLIDERRGLRVEGLTVEGVALVLERLR
jgi:hypothetical protein